MADDHEHDETTSPDTGHRAAPEIPEAQEERIIDKVVAQVQDVFREIAGEGGRAAEGAGSPTGGAAAPASPAATEAEMERKVREGVATEITKREKQSAAAQRREEHEAEHARMRAMAEAPPKVYSKLTTAIWGSDDS